MGITMRELSNDVLDEMSSAGRIILSPNIPIEAKENSLWFKTGVGDSEGGTILGDSTSSQSAVIIRNAQLTEEEPDSTKDIPFWFKVVEEDDNI